jgi:hypothetical protein
LKKETVATVLAMTLGALICLGGLYLVRPGISDSETSAVLTFAILSIFGALMPYAVSDRSTGSVTILTFLSSVVLVPGWPSVLSAACVVTLSEIFLRRQRIKAVFNVAQQVLSVAVASIAYSWTGAVGAVDGRELRIEGLLAAFGAFVVTNSVSVAFVVKLESGTSFFPTWRAFLGKTLFDFIALPFVYVLILVYVKFGVLPSLASIALVFVVRQLNSTNEELHRSNRELLELTVTTLEARDPYTSGHSKRVSQYSKMMGQAAGLHMRQLERLSIAALLHDVGKIHEVFAPILLKPGKLSPEERAVMESHPIKGAELVRISSHLRDTVEPIRHHHEAWDGSGYPDALAGEAIPLFSRIIAIADTIDAMASDRPYRSGLSSDKIRSELIRMSGIQFDPALLSVLFQAGTIESVLRLACDKEVGSGAIDVFAYASH